MSELIQFRLGFAIGIASHSKGFAKLCHSLIKPFLCGVGLPHPQTNPFEDSSKDFGIMAAVFPDIDRRSFGEGQSVERPRGLGDLSNSFLTESRAS